MARPRKDTDVAGQEYPAGPVTKTVTTAAKTRPSRTFRIDNVSASVWPRTIVKLEPVTYYSISFQRQYVAKGGEVKYSEFFDQSDLPKIISLCHQAGEYILELQRADLAKKSEQAPPAQ